MLVLHDGDVAGRRLDVVVTERTDGDLHPRRVSPDVLSSRQRALTGRVWAMADQVHGTAVWDPDAPDGRHRPPRADVVSAADSAVAMWSADCATVLLATRRHRLIGVHAGWRGLAAGVIDVAVAEAGDADDIELVATGPMIGPCCYEFGERDLHRVADGVGARPEQLAARTVTGSLALDAPAALRAALARWDLDPDVGVEGCTGCSDRWWSHRAGLDTERQALVGWWT